MRQPSLKKKCLVTVRAFVVVLFVTSKLFSSRNALIVVRARNAHRYKNIIHPTKQKIKYNQNGRARETHTKPKTKKRAGYIIVNDSN